MSANLILYLIIGILTFDFVLNTFLSYINSKTWTNKVPEELKELYDSDKYAKAQEYDKSNKNLSYLVSALSFVLSLAFILLGGFEMVDQFSRSYSSNPIVVALIFFGILYIALDVFSLPFSLYKTFKIEEKFGFNKMSLQTFIVDKIKGYLLIALIGGGLIALIILIYDQMTESFWWIAWLVVTAFTLFMASFYTTIFLPIFNKLKPLEEGSLRNKINEYSKKVKFPLSNIFVIDGSKRSAKANAFFSGMLGKKSIVLYDTLIEENTEDELVAVLAHEVGHYKKKHVAKSIGLSVIQTGVMLFILGLALKSEVLSEALKVSTHSFHIGLIAFGILFSPISTILGIFMNIFSRKNEFEADAFAKETSNKDSLISALKKLSVNHLSNLQPHPLYVFFNYSHPPLMDRIKALHS